MEKLLMLLFLGLFARTLAVHVRSWQLREYRSDRMRAWLKTDDGKLFFKNVWFFNGIFPRPVLTSRTMLMLGITGALSALIWILLKPFVGGVWSVLAAERMLWATVWGAVFITNKVRIFQEKQLFASALAVRKKADDDLTVIAITGSFGKSSTKEMLRAMLEEAFGTANVIATPKNENTEVSIARWIQSNKTFFQRSGKRFAVVEAGAYRVGELATVGRFVLPNISILTAIGAQHLELFGGFENLKKAKFELAQAALETVYYNAENKKLEALMQARGGTLSAKVIGVKSDELVTSSSLLQTSFPFQGQTCIIPFGGTFYVQNAMVGLQVAADLGADISALARGLNRVQPPDQNLKTTQHARGFYVLEDLYSANRTGVLAAIQHLAKVPGRRVFVGIPLRELGTMAPKVHHEIFMALKEIGAYCVWLKSDFADMGKELLGDRFVGSSPEMVRSLMQQMGTGDGILLESRLPKWLLDLVRA